MLNQESGLTATWSAPIAGRFDQRNARTVEKQDAQNWQDHEKGEGFHEKYAEHKHVTGYQATMTPC